MSSLNHRLSKSKNIEIVNKHMYIVFTLKMEYVSKITSGVEII